MRGAMTDPRALFITLADIEAAVPKVREVAYRTPLVPAGRNERDIFLKLETLQRTGAFKLRGAWNKMSRLTEREVRAGFVTVSAGNHGQGVAWCARKLGAPCTVWVPDDAVQLKVAAMQALGAKVMKAPWHDIETGLTDGRWEKGPETFVHPFGDPLVIAGQGTIGIEIVEDLPNVRTVLAPVGGGGLSTGVATAVKAKAKGAKVYGVQAEGAAPLPRSFETGKPENIGEPDTIADGMAAAFVFDYMWPVLRDRLDGALTVSEDDLRRAIRHMALECHVVAEGAGAAALAAAWRHRDKLEAPIACVVSGGNIDPGLLAEIVSSQSRRG